MAVAFALIVLVLGGTAILSIRRLTHSSAERDTTVRQHLEDVVLAERLRSAEDAEAAAGRGYLLTRNPDFLQRLEEAELAFDRTLRDLRARTYTPDGRVLLDTVLNAAARYEQAQRRVLGETAEGTELDEVTRQFEREVVPARRELNDEIRAFIDFKERRLEAGYLQARQMTSRAIVTTAIVLSVALLASVVVAWWMGRHLARLYRREKDAVHAAEHALAARDELLGIVAHDLRSPLTAITVKAGILKRNPRDADKVRAQAESIGNVTARMEYVIRSLLDATSMETGSFSIRRAPCDVEQMVRESVEMLASVASTKSVQLEAQFRNHGLWVSADRERVLQVLTNLVGNAIKFAFEGGKIEISVEHVGEDVRFSIMDDGPGIAPAQLFHVFDRYWKGEIGGNKGTGLGLYIAKGIVRAHGGRIWVESGVGQGATFRFTLALAEARRSDEKGRHDSAGLESREPRA
jgi:signal transduction histidine kinase